jgi:glutamyl-Q tRNA(Asp) synthetase
MRCGWMSPRPRGLVSKELVWVGLAAMAASPRSRMSSAMWCWRGKDTPASYHLAVVVDDALQGITLVTRGEDLLEATHLHRLLQELARTCRCRNGITIG